MIVSEENWQRNIDQGWRWVANLGGDPELDSLLIAQYAKEYGCDLVSIGMCFDDSSLAPSSPFALAGLAVYVCDRDELLEELVEDLVNLENGHEMFVVANGENVSSSDLA